MGKADLHIHTTASDGACRPDEIVELAKARHLDIISITDHDTIDGYTGAVESADSRSIRLIPGVEITALFGSREIHVLAYNFDPHDPDLKSFLVRQRQARLDRMKKILSHLAGREGLVLTIDEIKAEANSNNVGRPHLARVMVKKKMVASVAEAFIRYLGSSLIGKIETGYADMEQVVKVIRESGGVTVLAHPGPLYSIDEIEDFIKTGLDGIECIHPSHNFDEQKKFAELAEKHHLLVTGGSDFHGTGREYDPYFGIVTLSNSRVESLLRVTGNRKKMQTGTGS